MPSLPSRSRFLTTALAVGVGLGLACGLVSGCTPEPAEGTGSLATVAVRPVADPPTTSAPPAMAQPPAGKAAPRKTGSATPPSAPPKATPKPSTKPAVAGFVPVVGVSDGDTIKVRLAGTTERVRVIGIDTPELASHDCFAQQAASKMQSLVQSRQVKLVADPTQDDRDRYGRLLRHVRLADGRSVAELLIAGGFGREYTYDRAYAGQAAHLKAQSTAKAAHRGIWSSGCLAAAPAPKAPAPKAQAPKVAPSAPAASSGSCDIKGNIASDGERIYHVPGGAFYGVTKISESKGERWFCSESEAVRAGWRPSQR